MTIRLSLMVMILIGMAAAFVHAKNLASAKAYIEQARIEAEEMVIHLQKGHVGVFRDHTARFLKEARKALDEMPMKNSRVEEWLGHLQAAIEEGEKAIESIEKGKQTAAENHALGALSHTEEVYSISESF